MTMMMMMTGERGKFWGSLSYLEFLRFCHCHNVTARKGVKLSEHFDWITISRQRDTHQSNDWHDCINFLTEIFVAFIFVSHDPLQHVSPESFRGPLSPSTLMRLPWSYRRVSSSYDDPFRSLYKRAVCRHVRNLMCIGSWNFLETCSRRGRSKCCRHACRARLLSHV